MKEKLIFIIKHPEKVQFCSINRQSSINKSTKVGRRLDVSNRLRISDKILIATEINQSINQSGFLSRLFTEFSNISSDSSLKTGFDLIFRR